MNTAPEDFMTFAGKMSRYGLTKEDCRQALVSACAFFGIPVAARFLDVTWIPNSGTMFVDFNPTSYRDDIICYNLKEMDYLGVRTKGALSLVLTHECAHRVLQGITLPGKNGGRWEEELCCDFFMGVRAGVEGMSLEDYASVRNGLAGTSAAWTHPTGSLRYEVMSYALTYVGLMDAVRHVRRSINEYYAIYDEWRRQNQARIEQIQIPYL